MSYNPRLKETEQRPTRPVSLVQLERMPMEDRKRLDRLVVALAGLQYDGTCSESLRNVQRLDVQFVGDVVSIKVHREHLGSFQVAYTQDQLDTIAIACCIKNSVVGKDA